MHRSYISGVERGERNITLLNMHRIDAALGTTMALLFLVVPEITDPTLLSTPGNGDETS